MGQTASRGGLAVNVAPLVEQRRRARRPRRARRAEGRSARRLSRPVRRAARSDADRDDPRASIRPPASRRSTVVYPASHRLRAGRQPATAAVFERHFLIGARLRVAADAAAGRDSACRRVSATRCATTRCASSPSPSISTWTLRVVPAIVSASTATHAESFAAISFDRAGAGRRRAPAFRHRPRPPRDGACQGGDERRRCWIGSRFAASEGGYLNTADFLQFIRDAEAGVQKRGLFDGRGPLAILAIVFLGGLALNLTPCVLPMIPINLAIIGAGAQVRPARPRIPARRHLRRARWPSSTACSGSS